LFCELTIAPPHSRMERERQNGGRLDMGPIEAETRLGDAF